VKQACHEWSQPRRDQSKGSAFVRFSRKPHLRLALDEEYHQQKEEIADTEA
jgi:hypothetical protein